MVKTANIPQELSQIPSRLSQKGSARFWFVALATGITTGIFAILLTRLLEWVQRLVWGGDGTHILEAAQLAENWNHIAALLGAGIITVLGQLLLITLTSGNGIDVTSAIWFSAGRLPLLRTLGTATLSEIIVGMGASLGREGGPKQAGAVAANFFCDRAALSDEQRRLLVACGAGAGMAAAYGVPLGGALFSLEVLRGMLALRLVLPALFIAAVATLVSWMGLPNRPIYRIPTYSSSVGALILSLVIGLVVGLAAVGYIRAIAWADRNRPRGWRRFVLPIVVLGGLGIVSIRFPQLLGNGRDISELAFNGSVTAGTTLFYLVLLKPLATIACIRSGAPGGLFTPSLTFGALLGALIGWIALQFSPEIGLGLPAFVGAAAMVAATTQGPISAAVLMIEFSGHDRSFIGPCLVGIISATLISRTFEPRSIYDARLGEEEVVAKLAAREQRQVTA